MDHSSCPVIATLSGARVDLLHMRPEDVSIVDVARSLDRLPRFLGHTRRPYHVLEHSLHASHVARDLGGSPYVQYQSLLHDYGEAYYGDLPSPIKRWLGPVWLGLEASVHRAGSVALGLPEVFDPIVHQADRVMLWNERRDLIEPCDWWPMAGEEGPVVRLWPAYLTTIYVQFFDRYSHLRLVCGLDA